jgi:hypothetical protein
MVLRTNRRRLLAVVAIAMASAVAWVAANPLRRSDDALNSWLLKQVPRGASIEALHSAAAARGWRVNASWSGDQPNADWGGIAGETVVWVYLGGYWSVLRTDIDSFWAFDHDGHLIGVRTRRMTDSL